MIWIGYIVSYLLGACPFGVWFGKWFKQTDVREHGSGNSGATNSIRVLGKKIGVLVMLFDIAKGYLPVFVAIQTGMTHPLLFGLLAVLGHCFPVWVGFRGGKGVATAAGAFLAFSPPLIGIGVCVMALTLGLFRMVSLASSVASVAIAVSSYLFSLEAGVITSIIAALILYRHRSNFSRILAGTEAKLGRRKEEKV